MKRFLKLFILTLLIVAMAVPFAACDNGSSDKDNDGDKGNNETKTLILGTNATFPPFEFEDGGEIKGIDIDLAKAICKELGYELKIENLEFDALITALTTKKVDFVAAGMTITPERLEQVNFTDTYYTAKQVVIVKEGTKLESLEDLVGKRIGAQAGTTGFYLAEEVEGAKDNDLIVGYNAGADAVQALINGQIDAVIIDNLPATEFEKQNEGIELVHGLYEDEEYAMAFRKEDTNLLNDFNDAMKKIIDSGEFQNIVDKYMIGE